MRTSPLVLASVLSLVAVATAHADPMSGADQTTTAPGLVPAAEPAQPREAGPVVGAKSEVTATALAISGSLLGPALFVAADYGADASSPIHADYNGLMIAACTATVLAPSAGNWYAGKGLSVGLGLRVAGAAGFVLGASMMGNNLWTSNDGAFAAGLGIAAASVTTIAGGTVLDILEAHRSARAYNEAHRAWTIAPIVARTPAGQQTGLAIAGTF